MPLATARMNSLERLGFCQSRQWGPLPNQWRSASGSKGYQLRLVAPLLRVQESRASPDRQPSAAWHCALLRQLRPPPPHMWVRHISAQVAGLPLWVAVEASQGGTAEWEGSAAWQVCAPGGIRAS